MDLLGGALDVDCTNCARDGNCRDVLRLMCGQNWRRYVGQLCDAGSVHLSIADASGTAVSRVVHLRRAGSVRRRSDGTHRLRRAGPTVRGCGKDHPASRRLLSSKFHRLGQRLGDLGATRQQPRHREGPDHRQVGQAGDRSG